MMRPVSLALPPIKAEWPRLHGGGHGQQPAG